MKYLSICSGIEAATCAWHRLGWVPVAFAEIEAFPAAVLAHHYPDVPNLGDLTKYRDWPMDLLAEVDLLVGGTPCQAFSVAGARGSLTDERGNLTLIYAHLLDRIDEARALHGRPPALCLWENVPGVLNTDDNAFGCFLGILAGEDEALTPPGGRWTDAGYVRGPDRAIAWRSLDAQYFRLAQRRKRVFVVASAGEGCPAEILFESEGLRRDSPPSRGQGEGVAGTLEASVGSRGYKDNGDGSANLIPSERGGDKERGRQGEEICMATGQADAEIGIGIGIGPLRAREQDSHENLIAFSAKDHGADAGEIAPTLRSMGHDGSHANGGGQVAVAYDTTQITSAANRCNPQPGDPCHPLAAGAHPPLLVGMEEGRMTDDTLFCFRGTQDPCDGGDLAFALGRNSGQENAIAFNLRGRDGGAMAEVDEVDEDGLAVQRAASGGSSRTYVAHEVATFQQSSMKGKGTIGYDESGLAKPCKTQVDGQMIHTGMAVRRLTPRECERLQGFPDDYTLIPYRGKPAADGPRYKALGNSMAEPCMHWLGRRLDACVSSSPSLPL